MIGGRRLALRRGIGYLAAAFVSTPKEVPHVHAAAGNYGYPVSIGRNDHENDKRSALAEVFDRQREMQYRRAQRKYNSWFNQHGDLLTLQSTSQAWRASVMHDRLIAEEKIADSIQTKIRAIWKEPLDKITAMATKWITG